MPALLLRPISRSLYYSLSHAIVGACPQSLLVRRLRAHALPILCTPAAWCTLCLLLPERVNGVRVRISGQARAGLLEEAGACR